MTESLGLLSFTAISIGVIHTVLGPDHYLPFVMLGKAREWNLRRTVIITVIAGIGHVLGSVILGFIGIAIGISVFKLETIESFRGDIAAWLLIAFGLVYMVISLRNIIKKQRHTHKHIHPDGTTHLHEHNHMKEHGHLHVSDPLKTTPWVLFIIFVFGPCEPLIPVLMYPAAQGSTGGVLVVATLFSIATIFTMVAMVLLLRFGLTSISLKPIEKYNHVIAGFVILLSGVAIRFLGL